MNEQLKRALQGLSNAIEHAAYSIDNIEQATEMRLGWQAHLETVRVALEAPLYGVQDVDNESGIEYLPLDGLYTRREWAERALDLMRGQKVIEVKVDQGAEWLANEKPIYDVEYELDASLNTTHWTARRNDQDFQRTNLAYCTRLREWRGNMRSSYRILASVTVEPPTIVKNKFTAKEMREFAIQVVQAHRFSLQAAGAFEPENTYKVWRLLPGGEVKCAEES